MQGTRRRIPLRWALVASLVLLLAAVLTPVGRAGERDRLAYSETGYAILDPAWIRRPNDERLVLALYDGLTALDPVTGRIVPAGAARWEEAADGRSWTFHLHPGAVWSDGTPVKASDFIGAWKRVLDPYEPSPWAGLLRPMKGCGAISDGDHVMRILDAAVRRLKSLLAEHERGIPGEEITDLVERTGLGAAAGEVDHPAVKRLLRWGSDRFPKKTAEEAIGALKKERRRIKRGVNDAFDAFGSEVGAVAKDDRTLVVLLEGRCPWLPELLARAPFVPLHPRTLRGGETAFAPQDFLGNGAFRLKGRGSKPRAGVPDPDSVVHLVRSPRYAGPRKARLEEILCYTGQGHEEDLRRLKVGQLQWMANPGRDIRDTVQKLPGFGVRPTGRVLLLRLRADRAPFDRLEVRQAFAHALDRRKLAKDLWPTAKEASRLVPPTVAARVTGPRSPAGGAAAANKALEAAGLTGEDFPWVELHYEDVPGSGLDDLAEELLKQWDRALGVEMGLRIEDPEEAQRVREAGAFHLALGALDGIVGDPAAWLLPLAPDHPDAGLGWDDEGFAALLAAARDVDGFLEGGEDALAKLPDAGALRPKVETARRGGAKGRDALRLALLEAAEARLLEACVVIPLLWPQRAFVEKDVRDLGSPAAWKHPSFHGSLRSAHR